jgi:hypothetical protein
VPAGVVSPRRLVDSGDSAGLDLGGRLGVLELVDASGELGDLNPLLLDDLFQGFDLVAAPVDGDGAASAVVALRAMR